MSITDRLVPLGYRTDEGHDPHTAAAATRLVLTRAHDPDDARLLITALGLEGGLDVLAGARRKQQQTPPRTPPSRAGARSGVSDTTAARALVTVIEGQAPTARFS
ncbi:hypothetical protein Ae168Ps1_6145 [Pseudonocardia sp. Ae168_Ps1]|nr:hypothetical protein Ae150APs1_6079 [Pseudonocardia sp. Ae150A_Ps1]OLL70548.1 hypothetical protein Ae263Ps1_6298 [Pseudonocardia sp. Ae263_Ps1]OLL70680.1 hypothetical protein Ae168Ps1_6145 [Pseudonocardia sp. Ae168_Ps1]OLL89223.1 hypothetical protein Ae356Ps1_6142c [Pseudonocardia sp. Ae356_Ps1]